jgi:hypothetical protein
MIRWQTAQGVLIVQIETEGITKLEFVTLDKVYAREYGAGDMHIGDNNDVAVGISEALLSGPPKTVEFVNGASVVLTYEFATQIRKYVIPLTLPARAEDLDEIASLPTKQLSTQEITLIMARQEVFLNNQITIVDGCDPVDDLKKIFAKKSAKINSFSKKMKQFRKQSDMVAPPSTRKFMESMQTAMDALSETACVRYAFYDPTNKEVEECKVQSCQSVRCVALSDQPAYSYYDNSDSRKTPTLLKQIALGRFLTRPTLQAFDINSCWLADRQSSPVHDPKPAPRVRQLRSMNDVLDELFEKTVFEHVEVELKQDVSGVKRIYCFKFSVVHDVLTYGASVWHEPKYQWDASQNPRTLLESEVGSKLDELRTTALARYKHTPNRVVLPSAISTTFGKYLVSTVNRYSVRFQPHVSEERFVTWNS